MDLDEIINSIHTFIVYQPFIAMGIAAALGILIYIKPKEVLKVIVTFLAIIARFCHMEFPCRRSGQDKNTQCQ